MCSIPRAGAWAALYQPTPDAPLINLAQGVPGAPPPADFQKRLAESAANPASTSYGDLRGDAVLRAALAKDVNEVYGATGVRAVREEEITLTAGCNLVGWLGGSRGRGEGLTLLPTSSRRSMLR